jgi:hypothetical protein
MGPLSLLRFMRVPYIGRKGVIISKPAFDGEGAKLAVKHIPGVEHQWWVRTMRQKWLVELVGSVPPLVVAAIAAFRFVQDDATRTVGYWSAGAAAWLFLASLVKILHTRELDKDANAKRDHDGLRAAMLVLHASAANACGLADAECNQLRVTFHRVVPPLTNAEQIEQVVPYAGGDGGGEGRTLSVRSGITGRCIRTKQLYTMHRPDGDVATYKQQLEADWGYTQADANKLSTDKMSFMAVPVLDGTGKHALGVIYLDCVQPNMFESPEVQDDIFRMCGGVTQYVSERYR